MSRAVSTLVLFLAASPATAGQPVSESLVQCGALYAVASGWVRDEAPRERLLIAADAFAAEAETEAKREGRADPPGYVDVTWGAKCEEWSGKGAAYAFSQDFRDWTSYCRALAGHKGIRLPPG